MQAVTADTALWQNFMLSVTGGTHIPYVSHYANIKPFELDF